MARPDELPIFTRWVQFLEWLLPATEKFPKRVRFTFADRINNLALDIAEDLVEARYSRNKQPLPHQGYEHAARNLNEVGRMLGGWMKQQQGTTP